MHFQQRQDTDCDTMPLKDYEKLVASETKHVQAKVTAAIDKAMETIANKQSELLTNIKFDPRKRAAEKMIFELDFKICYPGLLKCQHFVREKSNNNGRFQTLLRESVKFSNFIKLF